MPSQEPKGFQVTIGFRERQSSTAFTRVAEWYVELSKEGLTGRNAEIAAQDAAFAAEKQRMAPVQLSHPTFETRGNYLYLHASTNKPNHEETDCKAWFLAESSEPGRAKL